MAENPFDKGYHIALYKSVKYGHTATFTYYGEEDSSYHIDYARISEPVEVKFDQLKSDEVIRNAVAACDAAEREAYRELNEKLAAIRERKQQFLALTHQAESDHG